MDPKQIFAGIDITTGRRPITLAALDDDFGLVLLEKCDSAQALTHLTQYKEVMLAINTRSEKREQRIYAGLKKKLAQAGFLPYLKKSALKQWVEMNSRDCFHGLAGRAPLPRRTFEGRIQRALILFEQGLRINDPMDFFEEITRHHVLMGAFPKEALHSASELDALVAAYAAWATIRQPVLVDVHGDKREGLMVVLRARTK